MLQEARDLQKNAVSRLVKVLYENKKEFTFKAPTGSGKTFMMADFMNRIISTNKNIIFIVSTLSKSNLAQQNFQSFKNLSENGTFQNLKPFLINSESSGEGSIFIPTDYNVYVLPRDLYKEKSKLKNEGTFLNFLQSLQENLFSNDFQKTIYLIKDECHIATTNLDELNFYFSKIINFSATPKLSRHQNPDVEITNLEAESVKLIKSVVLGNENDSLGNALEKFEEIKKNYINELKVNPCLIIQISNKDKAEEELKNNIFPSLKNHQELKWVYIAGEEKNCDTNDSGLKKLSVKKWKDYMKEKSSSISVIIFKMVISEGWDIPRACMLYQIRDSKSKQLDEQVMGRVRRNPRLLDFETLSSEAKELACKSWIWGIIPEESKTKKINLFKNYNIENDIRIKTTKLKNLNEAKFNSEIFLKNLKDENLTHKSIFELYHSLLQQNNEIQNLCYSYSDDFSKWRVFTENLSEIKSSYDKQICNYEKTMVVCDEVSFPNESVYSETEKTLTLNDWIWCRKDFCDDFSFDSEAEKKWAELLKDIRQRVISETSSLQLENGSNKFLWGKNFTFNSEIKFEYYLDGVHSSFPDFVMKDKSGRIHIFEVKSVNKSSEKKLDEEEYKQKVNALKLCYKECSKKTQHIFYLPILDGSDWKITKFENGEEETLSEIQLKEYLNQNKKYKINHTNFYSEYHNMEVTDK